MPISDALRDQLTAVLDEVETVEGLDEFVDSLDEDVREALSDQIDERRADLSDAPSLHEATAAELADHLKDRPEKRNTLLSVLEDEDEEEDGDEDEDEDEPAEGEDKSDEEEDDTEDDEDDTKSEEDDSEEGSDEEDEDQDADEDEPEDGEDTQDDDDDEDDEPEDDEDGPEGEEAEDSLDEETIEDNLDVSGVEDVEAIQTTLTEVAERLGADVSDDADIQTLLAQVNEASSGADLGAEDLNSINYDDSPSVRDSLRKQMNSIWGTNL